MTWSGTSLMDLRAQFAAEAASGLFSMTELCERYGISRKTGYKWEKRYDEGGRPACADASRAPKSHPNETPPEIVER